MEIVEKEVAREITRLIRIVPIATDFSTKLQTVFPAQVAESILINVALGGVHVLATHAKKRSES